MKKLILLVLLMTAGTAHAWILPYNWDFSIRQKGIGTGICSPGPVCWETPGWASLNNYTVNNNDGGYFALYPTVPTVRAAAGHRYKTKLSRLNNKLYIYIGCKGTGGQVLMRFYDAKGLLIYAPVNGQLKTDWVMLNVPPLGTVTNWLKMPSYGIPFTAPAGTVSANFYIVTPPGKVCVTNKLFLE